MGVFVLLSFRPESRTMRDEVEKSRCDDCEIPRLRSEWQLIETEIPSSEDLRPRRPRGLARNDS